ncbi:MAG: hypothetical protein ABEK10_02020 [Candidatus Nanosalina sp.]
MNLLVLVGTFATGFILGIGATLLYIQYTMYSQVGKMEEQMQEVMDLEEELVDMETDEGEAGDS